MKISKIYVYPIKSLRGIELPAAPATKHGFSYDRIFMLLKDEGKEISDPSKRYSNMAVAAYNQMSLFIQTIKKDTCGEYISVTFDPPGGPRRSAAIPLQLDVTGLEQIEVNLHGSPTTGFIMPSLINDYFSFCFEFSVIVAYVGQNRRNVLFQLDPLPAVSNQSWLGYLSGAVWGPAKRTEKLLTFADCAPFLVVSETSLRAVSKLLPGDQPMDITKFRPNIVISGADEEWEEDFWAELSVSGNSGVVSLSLERNCVRCRSINIDYKTGDQGKNESGRVLKLLQKDRRVDTGNKWSPVFGRYGFLSSIEGEISVGDEIAVQRWNEKRSVFDWPGI